MTAPRILTPFTIRHVCTKCGEVVFEFFNGDSVLLTIIAGMSGEEMLCENCDPDVRETLAKAKEETPLTD